MFCKRTVGWVGGTLMLCSTLLSSAHAAPGVQTAMAQVESFADPSFARANASATPALDKKIDLVFPLVFKKRAQLDALIQAQQDPTSPQYHQFLTPDQIGQRFGADTADLSAIVQYARSQGFTITNVWPNHLFVSVTTNVAQVEKAFHIHLQGYDRPKAMLEEGDPTTFFAPDRKPTVPVSIASRIISIEGLDNFLIARPAFHHKRQEHRSPEGVATVPFTSQSPIGSQDTTQLFQPTPDFTGALTPAQVSKVYNLDGLHNLGLSGQGMNIAVYSPTQFNISDVQAFTTQYKIASGPLTEKWVVADGRAPYDVNKGGAGEAALDCEIILGQANKATITLYETDGSTSPHTLDSWNQIASDHFPVVSSSWGIPESTMTQAMATSWDNILATMVAAGQSIFVATGDAGVTDGKGHIGIQAPSSSANVTAIGGTQYLTDNNGVWATEQGWSGSGGGLSVFYSQPSWQTGPGVRNSYSNGKRQVPDVAALADDLSPGYSICEYGKWYNAGGTSASTPLWAAAVLLMDQKSGYINKGTGNFAPLVYRLNASSVNAAFHDITTGSNGVSGSGGRYPCTSGWDFVTGWGSADFTKLYAALVGGSSQGASISGSVFYDKNGNGVKDPGDGPLTATVYLDLNNNGKLDAGEPSVTTNNSGNYSFTGLNAGTYYVRVVPGTGWHESLPDARYNGWTVTLASGQSFTGLQFGWTQTATILGYVYWDKNNNGQLDSTEPLLSGWTVFVDVNGTGRPYGTNPTTTTASDGTFEFDGLTPSTYIVRLAVLSGWSITQPRGYTGYSVPVTSSGAVFSWLPFGVH